MALRQPIPGHVDPERVGQTLLLGTGLGQGATRRLGTDLCAGPKKSLAGTCQAPRGVFAGGFFPTPQGRLLDPGCAHSLLPTFHTDPSPPWDPQPVTRVSKETYLTKAGPLSRSEMQAGGPPTLISSSLVGSLHPIPPAGLKTACLTRFCPHSADTLQRPRLSSWGALSGDPAGWAVRPSWATVPTRAPTSQDSSHTGQFCFLESTVDYVSVVCALLGLAWASAMHTQRPLSGSPLRPNSDVTSSGSLP